MVDYIDLNFGKKIIMALAHSETNLCSQYYLFANRSTAAEAGKRRSIGYIEQLEFIRTFNSTSTIVKKKIHSKKPGSTIFHKGNF